MTDNPKGQAIAALRSGDKVTARQLMLAYLDDHPQDDQAWFILSATVETAQRRRECLEMALDINPANQDARERLAKMDSAQAAAGRKTSLEEPPRVASTEGAAATPSRAQLTPPVTRSRLSPWLLLAAGISVLVMACAICFAAVGLTGWLGDDDESNVSNVEAATRTIPATNTPSQSRAQEVASEASSSRCAAAEDYVEAIDDVVADFVELANLSFDSTTADELALYSRTLSTLYDNFMEFIVPECGIEGATEMQHGMEAIIAATSDLSRGIIGKEEATDKLYDGARQMLRGYNVLLILSGEPPLDEPGSNSGSTLFTPPPLASSTPRLSPTLQATATPALLPIGNALVIDDGITSWEVTVTDIDYRSEMNLEVGGELVQQYIAEYRYVVLFLTALNAGRQTDFFFPHGLIVRDRQGREYERDQLATGVAEDFVYELDTLAKEAHPGEVAQTIAVFDLPFGKDPFSLHYERLILTGEAHPGVLLNIQD